MRLVRRTELTGKLAGRVEIEYTDDRGRTSTFITAIGSDSDVLGQPVQRPLAGRRFATHTVEMNAKRHFMDPTSPQAQICRELHDKSGKTERAWRERGGTYGRVTDHRGTVFQGPVFKNDAERKPYIALHNSLNPRQQISEA